MKYFNKRNNKVASLISEDSKFKTVLLEYEDGSTVSVSQSTFKRWWKTFSLEATNPEDIPNDQYVAEVMDQKKDLGIECPKIDSVEIVSEDKAGDGTPLAQVGKEILEGAKSKAEDFKKKKLVPIPGGDMSPEEGRERGRKQSVPSTKKKTSNPDKRIAGFEDIRSYLEFKGCEVREWVKWSLAVKCSGKPFMEIRTLRSGLYTVYCKEVSIQGLEIPYSIISNYYLPAVAKNISLEDIKKLLA